MKNTTDVDALAEKRQPDYAAFGRSIIEWARDPDNFFFAQEVSEEICEIAQNHGIVKFIPYDPAQHGEELGGDPEPGDMVWIWTEVLEREQCDEVEQ